MNRTRTGALLALTAALGILCVVGVAGTASASPVATAASTKCHLSVKTERNLGASYVTSLKVVDTSCGKGKKLVKAFNACRHSNGGDAGKCPSVQGYKCTDKRQGVPGIQYDSKSKCKKGVKVVKFTYTQDV